MNTNTSTDDQRHATAEELAREFLAMVQTCRTHEAISWLFQPNVIRDALVRSRLGIKWEPEWDTLSEDEVLDSVAKAWAATNVGKVEAIRGKQDIYTRIAAATADESWAAELLTALGEKDRTAVPPSLMDLPLMDLLINRALGSNGNAAPETQREQLFVHCMFTQHQCEPRYVRTERVVLAEGIALDATLVRDLIRAGDQLGLEVYIQRRAIQHTGPASTIFATEHSMDREPISTDSFVDFAEVPNIPGRSVRELVDALMSNTYPGFNSQEPERQT